MLGVLTVIAALFCGFDALKTRPSDGTVWLLGRPELEVLDVVPRSHGDPTPLRRGDKIVGIGNHIVSSPQMAARQLSRQRPGSRVPYLVKRDGQQIKLIVPLTSTRVRISEYALNVALAMVYLLIGFGVYLRSGHDRAVGLFFVLCLLFTLFFVTNLNQVSYYLGAIITQNIGAFARFMLPAVFLNFFLVFPRKKITLTSHPFLAPLLFVLPMMFYFRFSLDQFLGSEGAKIHATSWLILGMYYVLGLAALMHGYLSYRNPLMRERVRILTFGTMAGVIPYLIFKIGMEELSLNAELARLGVIPLVAIPISFGYCVARYQVMHIDLMLKKRVTYALLVSLIWIGYLGGAWWLGGKILAFLPGSSSLEAAGVALAVAAALWPFRTQVQRALDNRFYHSRDNMTTLIQEFTREIPRFIQRDDLLQMVGDRLCGVLQLPGMGAYLATTEDNEMIFQLRGRIGESNLTPDPSPQSETESGEDRLLLGNNPSAQVAYPEKLQIESLAQTLELQEEPLWIEAGESLEDESKEAITREQSELRARHREQLYLIKNGIQLLIPLIAQERLLGLIALPSRPGEDGYQVHELQLLTIVAGQVALQLENSRLYEEEVAKGKLEEEMAMARRIQSRLLPGTLPSIDGVEIQAVNISSKQVSGDYYDLIEREDGKLGIIIADVSGKGMPASLLASNLQAAMRAQCDTCTSPAEVLERINRQMHASTDPQHFATLFLAIFDPAERRFLYSSGGHNAPVVLRADGSIQLLEAGGLPLGAFDFGTYEEDEISLEEGDLVFLYTDGLTETKDPDDEDDFGEERLNDLLRDQQRNNVSTLFDQVHLRLKEFSGREDADDDITMIGLKISATEKVALAEGNR
ncbi:MAG: SpoIIE family protein phosphatase [Gemmatimonadales bacterium]|nr:SpoIIE family protein phosphatase [Gemmatimonadales bacterium]